MRTTTIITRLHREMQIWFGENMRSARATTKGKGYSLLTQDLKDNARLLCSHVCIYLTWFAWFGYFQCHDCVSRCSSFSCPSLSTYFSIMIMFTQSRPLFRIFPVRFPIFVVHIFGDCWTDLQLLTVTWCAYLQFHRENKSCSVYGVMYPPGK